MILLPGCFVCCLLIATAVRPIEHFKDQGVSSSALETEGSTKDRDSLRGSPTLTEWLLDLLLPTAPEPSAPTAAPLCDFAAADMLCKKEHVDDYKAELRSSSAARRALEGSGRPILGDGEVLMQRMQAYVPSLMGTARCCVGQPVGLWANQSFELLRTLSAWDILAFRETWTDRDTELLRRLNGSDNGFTEGSLSTKNFANQLPSTEELKQLLRKKNIAIVGSGRSLEGHGHEIDSHPVVARFNNMVGANLDNKTGARTDVHVMNAWVSHLGEPQAINFDLETIFPWQSYCRRMLRGGEFFQSRRMDSKLFMIRPSAICALSGSNIAGFSRGFLFYWFVGSLFEHQDLYGMGMDDGRTHIHYRSSAQPTDIQEWAIDYEHLLYREAAAIKA